MIAAAATLQSRLLVVAASLRPRVVLLNWRSNRLGYAASSGPSPRGCTAKCDSPHGREPTQRDVAGAVDTRNDRCAGRLATAATAPTSAMPSPPQCLDVARQPTLAAAV